MEPYDDDHAHIRRIPWNDFAALERVVAEHPKDVAGFIASPYHHPAFADNEMPAEGYWQKVQQFLKKERDCIHC